MAIRKFKPSSPDRALGKIKGDAEFARFAHLNRLVDDVEVGKANQEVYEMSYPFIGYPESTLINAGPTYSYPTGQGMGPIPAVTLNSYKVRGIIEYSGNSIISQYLGTIKLIPGIEYATLTPFPGKITGMVMAGSGVYFSPPNDITSSPLASGALVYDVDISEYVPLQDLKIMFYSYGETDPDTGEMNFALVLEGYTETPTTDLGFTLISYEIEFDYLSTAEVSLWWD